MLARNLPGEWVAAGVAAQAEAFVWLACAGSWRTVIALLSWCRTARLIAFGVDRVYRRRDGDGNAEELVALHSLTWRSLHSVGAADPPPWRSSLEVGVPPRAFRETRLHRRPSQKTTIGPDQVTPRVCTYCAAWRPESKSSIADVVDDLRRISMFAWRLSACAIIGIATVTAPDIG